MGLRVAIVGATGNVGREMLDILDERKFPIDEVFALASSRSRGNAVQFGNKELTVEDVAPIYKKGYWDKMKCDDLPSGLDLCVFDFGVNAGPGRAAKFLQKMIGTTVDGGIGPMTLAKVNKHVGDNGLKESIKQYQNARQKYYENLSTFDTFGKGWTRRVEETTKLALEL